MDHADTGRNFCALDEYFSDYKKARFVIIPAPLEATVSWGEGTRLGPRAIIEASEALELYDEETDSNPAEKGINTLEQITDDAKCVHSDDIENILSVIEKNVEKCVKDKKIPVILGGEHTVSLGAFRALKKKYKDYSVLQIDAHADLRDEFDGTMFSHACVMRRGLEYCSNIVQVGIRSISGEEKEFMDDNKARVKTIFAREIAGKKGWIDDAMKGLKENVYITIDVDGLDPAVVPATGTPEPGGMTYYELIGLLKEVASKRNVIGIDIVELAPKEGLKHADYACAKIAYKCMAYIRPL